MSAATCTWSSKLGSCIVNSAFAVLEQTLFECGCRRKREDACTPPLTALNAPPSRSLRSLLKTSTIKMTAVQTLPREVSKLGSEVKLFGKWDTQECVIMLR